MQSFVINSVQCIYTLKNSVQVGVVCTHQFVFCKDNNKNLKITTKQINITMATEPHIL